MRRGATERAASSSDAFAERRAKGRLIRRHGKQSMKHTNHHRASRAHFAAESESRKRDRWPAGRTGSVEPPIAVKHRPHPWSALQRPQSNKSDTIGGQRRAALPSSAWTVSTRLLASALCEARRLHAWTETTGRKRSSETSVKAKEP
eukprot:6114830-Pleurochrysis_carterae.AAC.3